MCNRANNRTRTLAFIIAFLMLACVLCSFFLTAAEAGHDCSGEDCPICSVLELCERMGKRIRECGVAFFVIICLFPMLAEGFVSIREESGCMTQTPVSRKVRLNR